MLKRVLLTTILICLPSFAVAQDEPDHEIHEELRALLTGIQTAINTEQYGDLAQYFHEDMRATTITQEFLASPNDIEPYFTGWFGEGGFLTKLDMTLEAEVLTELYADKTMGIARGSGIEDYLLSDGRFFSIPTRWTATVIKGTDEKWRILALHIGTNFVDNPLLAEVEGAVISYAIRGGAIGAFVGLVLGFLIGRLRRKAA